MKVLSRRAINTNDVEILKDTSAKNEAIRQLREPLLSAFDIYKTNVQYGIEYETELEHQQIVSWYRGLLDLSLDCIENVPYQVKKYL